MTSKHSATSSKARQKPIRLPTGRARDKLMERIRGRAAHVRWERSRTDENECDAESRMRKRDKHSKAWWEGWFERSDEWRQDDDET